MSITQIRSTVPQKPSDRRTAFRAKAHGSVTLTVTGPTARAVKGELRDVSDTGFRVVHRDKYLGMEEIVSFQFAGRKGQCRCAWTKVEGDRVESGFEILAPLKMPPGRRWTA